MQNADFSVRRAVLEALIAVQEQAFRVAVERVSAKKLRFHLGIDCDGVAFFKGLAIGVGAEILGIDDGACVLTPVAAAIDQQIGAALVFRPGLPVEQRVIAHVKEILAEAAIAVHGHGREAAL